jgi:signal transduction histidine kinase/CheY-like chemotaxis protein
MAWTQDADGNVGSYIEVELYKTPRLAEQAWLWVVVAVFTVAFTALTVTAFARLRMRKLSQMSKLKLDALEARLEKEKAEASARAKTNFLATMSHEIRTPMNAILGITQIQLQKDDLPSDYSEAFEKIYNSGSILLGIINDILDLSKIDTGKLELNAAEYDLPSLINDTVQLNVVRIGFKPIEFVLRVDENLPSRMRGDELRLKQILNNLLSNAVKYTEKGYVRLSVDHKASDGDVSLCFVVEDTGQGIKQEDRERLFMEYERFNTDTNREVEGIGLGLNITKKLVEMMDGAIEVESEYGKGSVFTVSVRQKAVSCPVIGAELSRRLRDFTFTGSKQFKKPRINRELMPYGKVLVVDDVETNLYVAEGMLTPYGLNVETAVSGFAAIERVKSGKAYDIIFMDHMMPLMDGIETVKKLRGMGYEGAIVALTANALVGSDEMFKQNGFDGFISKPIDSRRLDTLLDRLVRGRHTGEAANRATETAAASPKKVNPKLLAVFKRDARKSITAIRETIASGDAKLFNITVHAMKSALANIGEHDLSALASSLEKSGLSGSVKFAAAVDDFVAALEKIIEGVNSGETEANIGANAVEDTAYLSELLPAVKSACENYDRKAAYSALDLLEEKPRKPQTAAALKEIREALFLHSDFEEAAKLAGELSESIRLC